MAMDLRDSCNHDVDPTTAYGKINPSSTQRTLLDPAYMGDCENCWVHNAGDHPSATIS